jgi:Tetratricopeptide repeat
MNNLAVQLGDLGQHEEAAAQHRQTLAIRQRVLWPEHPDTLDSMNNLAVQLGDLGQHEDAAVQHRQTLAAAGAAAGAPEYARQHEQCSSSSQNSKHAGGSL